MSDEAAQPVGPLISIVSTADDYLSPAAPTQCLPHLVTVIRLSFGSANESNEAENDLFGVITHKLRQVGLKSASTMLKEEYAKGRNSTQLLRLG